MALKRAGWFWSRAVRLLALLRLLGQQNSLDVGQNTTLGNGDTREQFVQLLVVADGELKMTRDDPALLVVTGSVASELQHFSGQVFHDGGKVDWCTSSDPFAIVSLAQMTVNSADGELQTSTA